MTLEWSLSMNRSSHRSFAKVFVDKTPSENVLGNVGPNAEQLMQGFGAARKFGLTYKKLTETVGTTPEEVVGV
jgi:pyruvate/2-oxoglutarate dehydrogenase complex dihydrolipoamide dehydrogenase (E3) component